MPNVSQTTAVVMKAGYSLQTYIPTFNPVLWYRHQQTSGTNEPNDASPGTLDGTIVNSPTLNQTGFLGAGEAYDVTGSANEHILVANDNAWAALEEFTYILLFNHNTEVNARFFATVNDTSGMDALTIGASESFDVRFDVDTTGTTPSVTLSSFLDYNKWTVMFFEYRQSDHLIRVTGMQSDDGALSTNSASAGTGDLSAPAGSLYVWNRPLADKAARGLWDEFILIPTLLTSDEKTFIAQLMGFAI